MVRLFLENTFVNKQEQDGQIMLQQVQLQRLHIQNTHQHLNAKEIEMDTES